MGKLIVIQNDEVKGTDKHNVAGPAKNTKPPPAPPTVPNTWIGDFDYVGKMTSDLSDFVNINSKPAALKNSKSSLNPGETAPTNGKHSGPQGKNLIPQADPTNPDPFEKNALLITDTPLGEGVPNSAAGSSFVKVGGVAVVLDGDTIDTCNLTSKGPNSTVTAKEQDFVSCSE